MSYPTSFFIAALALSFVTSTFGHSQMRCANYDMASGNCLAPIRNAGQAFESEANKFSDNGQTCQTPWSNPITQFYGGNCPTDDPAAACPLPMGTFIQGQNFTIMWLARNHATADQTPGNISLYLSPVESATAGVETPVSDFENNKFCQAPFMSCNGQNGNFVQCYATCQMPANTAVGLHTLWWKWVWPQNPTSIYTTCADAYVVASGAQPSSPSSSTTASSKPMTTASSKPITTASSQPMTTGAPRPMTTGLQRPMTTASAKPMTTAAQPTQPTQPSQPAQSVQTSAAMTSTSASSVASSTSAASSSGSSPSTSCNIGDMICVPEQPTQYQTCSYLNRAGDTYWASAQTCNTNLFCHPDPTGNKIHCY